MTKTAIIFEAHGDDLAVGVGATVIKLAKEGYKIIDVVFSAGQKSLPHYREDIVIKKRIEEAENIGKQFGISQNIFFGFDDGKLKKEIEEKDAYEKVRRIIKKYSPSKIFTTSEFDIHYDHRAVNKVIMEVVNELDYKCDVYSYEVWNIIKENKPLIYNDISDYFKGKIAMMKSFRSQWHFMYPLLIPVYLRARYYGMKNNCKYAEKLYKLK